jgi:hypothetical protein
MAGALPGSAQRDHEVGAHRVARPHLDARHPPAVPVAHTPSANRREVASGVRLAHADAKTQLAPADWRQQPLLLFLSAITQQHLGDLPVGHPVMPNRGTPAQQLLHDYKAVDGRGVAAAIARWHRHADPTTFGQRGGELGIDLGTHPEAGLECSPGQRLDQECANLLPQFQLLGGERSSRRGHTWQANHNLALKRGKLPPRTGATTHPVRLEPESALTLGMMDHEQSHYLLQDTHFRRF